MALSRAPTFKTCRIVPSLFKTVAPRAPAMASMMTADGVAVGARVDRLVSAAITMLGAALKNPATSSRQAPGLEKMERTQVVLSLVHVMVFGQ